MVSVDPPVFVTTTAVCVSVLFTRLLPKSNAVVLNDAVVIGAGGAAIVNAVAALCESVPEVPVTVMFAVPGAALAAAVMLIGLCEPGVSDRLDGVAVTPAGSVPTVTAMLPLKPFNPVATTLTVCAAPPGTTVTLDGAATNEKSWLGVGFSFLLSSSLPHPTSAAHVDKTAPRKRR